MKTPSTHSTKSIDLCALRMTLARIIQLTSPTERITVISWAGERLHWSEQLGEPAQRLQQRLFRLCHQLSETLHPWQEITLELQDGALRGKLIAFDRRVIYLSITSLDQPSPNLRMIALRLDQQRREHELRTNQGLL
jgi:hypothetical protein